MKADVITVEGKEWSASNASEAEEILPKCAKEKIKYSGLSLTNHPLLLSPSLVITFLEIWSKTPNLEFKISDVLEFYTQM